MESEINVLFLDHRLRDIDKVFNRFHNGECQRTQLQLSAFYLRYIQNIVDQRQQMIAGQSDFPKTLTRRLNIPEILLGNRRKAYDGIHGRADVVRHGGEKIGLCFACGFRLTCCGLKSPVQIKHVMQVKQEKDQKTGRNNSDQQPVFRIHIEILRRHETQ